jgi:hypothetical protein
MLFSPLALPDIDVAAAKNGEDKQVRVTLNGVALFDRKRRTTEYKAADSGYVSAWYLDEDYDGDCFVDCQTFFDFKKAPNIRAALSAACPRLPSLHFGIDRGTANRRPCRIVLLHLPDRVIGVLLRPPDRLERRAGDRISPDGSRRRRAADQDEQRHRQQRGAHRAHCE